jgi:integrase
MARRARDPRLESRTARLKLEPRNAPYWSVLAPGLSLGYRKGGRGGSWFAKLHDDATGRRYQTRIGTADDALDPDDVTVLDFWKAQEKARSWFREQSRRLAGLDVRPAGPYTVEAAMRDYLHWLEMHRKTSGGDRVRVNALILPELGKMELRRLTADRIRSWLQTMAMRPARLRTRKGSPPKFRPMMTDPEAVRRRRSTANRTLSVLKAGLNHAWREGRADSDEQWRRVRPFREVDAARVRYLTTDDARRLLDACETSFRPFVHGALLTGARYGELAALRVEDVDATNGTIHIRRSKSGTDRHIVLNAEGVHLFEELCAERGRSEFVFAKQHGKPWGKSHQHRPFRDACKRAGIVPAITFHELRHTWASLSIMAGAPLIVVAKNLGHSDTRMVERHYGHLATSYIAEVIRRTAPRFNASSTIAAA